MYDNRLAELRNIVAERKQQKAAWAAANPDKAVKLAEWFGGVHPTIDWDAIEQKADAPTRNASATVLGILAEKYENMIVSSADLSNSDKTDGFLKKTHAFTPVTSQEHSCTPAFRSSQWPACALVWHCTAV